MTLLAGSSSASPAWHAATYFDAHSQAELAATFAKAAATKKSEVVVKVVAAKTGILALPSLKRGGVALSHAETGKAMDFIAGPWPKRELPVGIYNVKLANGIWTGIQIKPGETTVLEPALLRIENDRSDNMELLDPETNEQLGYSVQHADNARGGAGSRIPGPAGRQVQLAGNRGDARQDHEFFDSRMLRVNDPSHAKTLQFYVVSPRGGGPEEAFKADKRVNLPPGRYPLWNIHPVREDADRGGRTQRRWRSRSNAGRTSARWRSSGLLPPAISATTLIHPLQEKLDMSHMKVLGLDVFYRATISSPCWRPAQPCSEPPSCREAPSTRRRRRRSKATAFSAIVPGAGSSRLVQESLDDVVDACRVGQLLPVDLCPRATVEPAPSSL